jgi:hypothetical protein
MYIMEVYHIDTFLGGINLHVFVIITGFLN